MAHEGLRQQDPWSHGERRPNQQSNLERYREWRDELQCGHKVQ